MRPVLFRWRCLTVWSYPAMLYLGLLFGVAAGSLAAKVSGMNAFRVYLASLILLLPALAGARLLWVASHWSYYRNQPRQICDRRQGGLMMYGAVPLMLLFSFPLLRMLRLNFGAFWDVNTFTILVGMILTRVGCLLNGCCAGKPSRSWIAIRLPNHTGVWQKRIPNQILEAICATGFLLVAMANWGKLPFAGALFLVVLLGYSILRFGMEFLRERETEAAGLTAGHSAAMISLLASVAILAVRWPR